MIFNDGISKFLRSSDPWNDWWSTSSWPTLEIKEPDVDFSREIEMAGTKKTDISVKLKAGQVTVTWTTRSGLLRSWSYFLGEKYYETDKLSVKYEDGMLYLSCPLKKQVPPPSPPEQPEIDIEIK